MSFKDNIKPEHLNILIEECKASNAGCVRVGFWDKEDRFVGGIIILDGEDVEHIYQTVVDLSNDYVDSNETQGIKEVGFSRNIDKSTDVIRFK